MAAVGRWPAPPADLDRDWGKNASGRQISPGVLTAIVCKSASLGKRRVAGYRIRPSRYLAPRARAPSDSASTSRIASDDVILKRGAWDILAPYAVSFRNALASQADSRPHPKRVTSRPFRRRRGRQRQRAVASKLVLRWAVTPNRAHPRRRSGSEETKSDPGALTADPALKAGQARVSEVRYYDVRRTKRCRGFQTRGPGGPRTVTLDKAAKAGSAGRESGKVSYPACDYRVCLRARAASGKWTV